MPNTNRSPEEGGKAASDSMWTTARETIKSIVSLATTAMQGGSVVERILVLILTVIGVLAVLSLFLPPYTSEKQLTTLFLSIGCLFVAFLLILRRHRQVQGLGRAQPGTIRLPQPVFESVVSVLGDARSKVYEFLKQSCEALSDDQVRANIFFPTRGSSGEPGDYELRIYPGLHLNMELSREREIPFQPKQGATGQAFDSGLKIVTQRLENGDGNWDEKFNMTEELSERVHPDLQWITTVRLTTHGRAATDCSSISYDCFSLAAI